MGGRRPIGFIVIAVINFVAALSFIACAVCSNVSDAQTWFIEVNGVRFDEKKLNVHLKDKAPAYMPVKIGGIVLGYAVCLGLILSGAALLFGGLIPKLFALFVYAVGILHHVIMLIYQMVFVNPAIDSFFNQIPPAIIVGQAATELSRGVAKFPGFVAITWWIVGIMFYLIAAVVVGISSTAAPEGEDEDEPRRKRRRDEDEDDEDDEDDEEDEEDEEDEPPPKKRSRR